MNKETLIHNGDAALMKALANMFAILNGDGEILAKLGGDSDRMVFTPRLDCDGDRSVILFGDEGSANDAIEEILKPQDAECEYHVFKFEPVDDGSAFDEELFEYDPDMEDCVCIDDVDGDFEERCEDECDCDNDSQTPMTLDFAISHAREAASKMLSEDPECRCGKEHLQLAEWLEELRELREKNCCDSECRGDGECDEASECGGHSLDDMRRILNRNGYQLVSQVGGRQKWANDDIGESLELPCGSHPIGDGEWDAIVESHSLATEL